VTPDVEPVGARSHRILSSHPLAWFVVRRCLIGVLLVVAVSVVVFAATEVLPGDAARAVLGARASEEQVAQVRKDLELDEPAVTRYGKWIEGLVHGDLGTSLTAGASFQAAEGRTSVATLIGDRVRNTAILALVTIALLLPLSVVLGAVAGIRPGGSVDQTISLLTLAGIAVPEFVVGTLLIFVFALTLGLLPPISLVPPGATPLDNPRVLVLPVVTLLIVALGFTVRQIRAGVAEAMRSDYVQMARLSGIHERRVVRDWALRNSVAPAIQTMAQVMQYFLGGVVLVEYVFGYPGIGDGLVEFVNARDIPSIQAVAVLIATIYIALNILADVLVVLVVPRLRTSPQ
jgi:peptide/nickel transport system permease protein